MQKDISTLSQVLGYTFKQPSLLTMALTHRSKERQNNERLEFLGDGIVNMIAAVLLYQQFPAASEGELTRWRSSLVNRTTLAELAKQFKLNEYLLLGKGELCSGGEHRQSTLSCAMEAVIGAIFLDSDFTAVYACLERWYQPWLAALSSAELYKDPKTMLQEYLQRHHLNLPTYTIEAINGKAHEQQFVVSCAVPTLTKRALGQGMSRRQAEQAAAETLLAELTQKQESHA